MRQVVTIKKVNLCPFEIIIRKCSMIVAPQRSLTLMSSWDLDAGLCRGAIAHPSFPNIPCIIPSIPWTRNSLDYFMKLFIAILGKDKSISTSSSSNISNSSKLYPSHSVKGQLKPNRPER